MTERAFRIHTPDQRLRVFVSSTLEELEQERSVVRRAIETLRLTPVMFELGARPYAPRALYRAYLEQSHVFLAIYWQSYGWVAPEESVSGLEDEYRLSGARPRLVYVRRPAAERHERLEGLLEQIRSDGDASYRQFSSVEELEQLVQDDLMVLLTERFEAAESPASAAPARTLTAPPVPLTPTVGRSAEIDQVRRLLSEGCRMLTLVGPGGVGKTRLALESCRSMSSNWPDGVVFVPLESVHDASDVIRVIAGRIGATIEGAEPPLEVVVRHLTDRSLLLLLDNFEQVLGAGSELSALLDACPNLSVLVTSRRPLRVRGERQLVVEPLPLPPSPSRAGAVRPQLATVVASPSVELFVEEARRVRPDFDVDPDNADAVAELVRRLDGLPLAIELAAARTNVLEPRQLLDRLERGLQVSMSAGQDVPERQRTLRATLEWSHSLLTPAQQALLARLSVFADGATLEAIEVVCAGEPVVDLLGDVSALLDNGLLRADREHAEGQPRFTMLVTVREFAAERFADLPDADAVTTRFVEWAVGAAAQGDPVRHPDAAERWPELRVEARNLRLAAQLLIDRGDWEGFADLAGGVLHWIYRFGHLSAFSALAERALTEAGEPGTDTERAVIGRVRTAVSWARFLVGDVPGALEAMDAVDIDEFATTDPAWAALQLSTRAMALTDELEARATAQRSLALAERTGFVAVCAYDRSFLASLDLIVGDVESAEKNCVEAMALATACRIDSLAGQMHGTHGLIAISQGRVDEGRERLATAYSILEQERSLLDAAVLLGHAAALAAAEDRPDEAATLSALAEASMTRLGLADWPSMEGARRAAAAAAPRAAGSVADATVLEADPWDVLAAALGLPSPVSP